MWILTDQKATCNDIPTEGVELSKDSYTDMYSILFDADFWRATKVGDKVVLTITLDRTT